MENQEAKAHVIHFITILWMGLGVWGCVSVPERGKSGNVPQNQPVATETVPDRVSMTRSQIESHLVLVSQLLEKGQDLDALELSLRLADEKHLVWQDLYRISKSLGAGGHYQHVIQVLEKTTAMTQNNAALLTFLCVSYEHYQFYKEAWMSCDRALRVSEETQLVESSPQFYSQILLIAAKIAYQLQRDEDVLRLVSTMRKHETHRCEAAYLEGKHYYRRSQIPKSIDALNQMAEGCQQKYPRSQLLLVLALARQQKKSEALTLIDKALASDFGDQQVKVDMAKLRERLSAEEGLVR
jgi:tetratricopeptide (TPR) repeat protein